MVLEQFIKRYGDRVTGVLSGFDRVLLRGTLRSLSRPEGLLSWLNWKGVLLKDFRGFAEGPSARLREHARQLAEKAGRPYRHLSSPKESKEKIAEAMVQEEWIREGLVCVLTAVEPCFSYSVRGRRGGWLELRRERRQCLFLYFYYVDREFGLMHVRLQSWFPFDVQVCLNGREWLARKMDRAGLGYRREENCFTWLEDVARTQALADGMLETRWERVLEALVRRVNPLLKDLLREKSYYWTVRQDEYATDVMFRDRPSLAEIYPGLVRQAMENFRSEDVLRFLGRKLDGRFRGEVNSDLRKRPEGVRVRHRVQENWLKMYDKRGCVLRIETAINNPERFRAWRRGPDGKRAWLPLRQGVADLRRRVQIARAANTRYLEALASVPLGQPACRVLDPVSRPVERGSQRFRALRPVAAEEAHLFASVMRGEFLMQGFRNADLREHLFPDPSQQVAELRRRTGQTTRRIRLLRGHRLVRKLSGTNRYLLTRKALALMSTALNLRQFDVNALPRAA